MLSFHSFSDELRKIAATKAETYKTVSKSSPVEIRMHKDADQYGGGYFDQEKKEIVLSKKNYETLAHEVGHAVLQEGIPGKIMQHPTVRAAFFATPAAVAGAAILVAKKHWWGPLLPLATAAPTLLSEHLATRKGRQLLEAAGVKGKALEHYKDSMWDAYKTYIKATFLPALGLRAHPGRESATPHSADG